MNQKDTSESKELVFIHGAWVSGWGWEALVPYLATEKVNCHIINLPGSESKEISMQSQASLEDYVAHVSAKIDEIQKPVWLVGHSGGGLTATAVAEAMPDKVIGIIYVAGMMLPSGVSYMDFCKKICIDQNIELKGISPYLKETAFGSFIDDFSAIKRIFLQDAPDELITEVISKMVVQPNASRLVSVNWTEQRAGNIPKFYIEALHDNSLLLVVQKEMQQLTPPVKSVGMESGHFPQVTMPEQLAAIIRRFIY